LYSLKVGNNLPFTTSNNINPHRRSRKWYIWNKTRDSFVWKYEQFI